MDYEYWLRLGMGRARFVHLPARLAGSRLHGQTKTVRAPVEVHTEINRMLRARLGKIPDNWFWNYAHAVLDGRGVPRTTSRGYTLRASLLTTGAAIRWNGYPRWSLLRMLASRLRG
jgi:hypothetical protein